MSEEHREEEQQRYTGLTTAVLADAGAPTSLKKETGLGQKIPAIAVGTDEQSAQLLSPDEAKEFRVRWDTIQGGFVDEPRRAVEQADILVAGAMKRLAEVFAAERAKLEGQWEREESASTEDLRLALRRYRAFFGRLLSV